MVVNQNYSLKLNNYKFNINMIEKSVSGELNKLEWKQYLINTLRFTAPTLAVFFGQLAVGVDWRAASAVALLALYGNLSDYFKKLNQGK